MSSEAQRRPLPWMAGSFGAALVLAGGMIALQGAGEKGIDAALSATGRLNFLLFWPAYVGSAPSVLFVGRRVAWLGYGQMFGLGFAAALPVHLGLTAWLCAIGAAPAASTFAFFGTAAGFVYLLALGSWRRMQAALGARGWWLIRNVGLNYIAYAFAADFLRDPLGGDTGHVLAYAPFALLSVVGPGIRLAAALRPPCAVGLRTAGSAA